MRALLLIYAQTHHHPTPPLALPVLFAPMDPDHSANPPSSPPFGSEEESDNRDLGVGLADAQLALSRRRMLDLVNRLHSTG